MVLLNTENYNLHLPSAKLAPRWLGPLCILQIQGPNTVLIEVPPRLSCIQPIQNVQWLRKYIALPSDQGPTPHFLPPRLIGGKEEFEVNDIIAHQLVNKKTQYLVQFKSYGPEDDLWLPKTNLSNAPAIVHAYEKHQLDCFHLLPPTTATAPRTRPHRAP